MKAWQVCRVFRHVLNTKYLNTNAFNTVLEEEEMPLHWKWSAIILLPNVYKLSSKVLKRILCQIPDGNQPAQQAVFHCLFITTEYVLPYTK